MEFTNDGIVLKTLNVKYINTRTDKYDNGYAYYAILNDNIKCVSTKLADSETLPYFLGSGNFILKVRSRYLKDTDKISGTATVDMKHYEYTGFSGYLVNKFSIK